MLPNLIIIGAMKCGTTSLHYYLDQHPEIAMSAEKETDFFTDRVWERGVDWYEKQFEGGTKIRGEASPNYSKHPHFPHVPERMHSLVPDAKIVYVVRDPIRRIVSQYVHECSAGREKRSLADAVREDSTYVDFSRYHMQIERFLRLFDREQVLIVAAEDLKGRRKETLRETFSFLGVDPDFDSDRFDKILHESGDKRQKNTLGRLLSRYLPVNKIRPLLPSFGKSLYKSVAGAPIQSGELEAETHAELIELLRDDVTKLGELCGRDFAGWLEPPAAAD